VVAEGVETAAQARVLLDMGCEVGQGMGIAAPMPADEVPGWVRSWKGLFALTQAPAPTSPGDLDGGGVVVDHVPPGQQQPPPRGLATD